MREFVAPLLAFWLVGGLAPGTGAAADQRLTPEQIVEFFTGGPGAPAPETAATRGLSGDGAGTASDRSVHVGPTGFGTAPETGAATNGAAEGLDLLITFEHYSSRLTGEARRNLDAFVAALGDPRLGGLRFAVEGHTDARGSEAYNQGLSERRAAAVVDYLTEQGVEAARLTARGFGETRPRTPDPMLPQNRRVETRRLP